MTTVGVREKRRKGTLFPGYDSVKPKTPSGRKKRKKRISFQSWCDPSSWEKSKSFIFGFINRTLTSAAIVRLSKTRKMDLIYTHTVQSHVSCMHCTVFFCGRYSCITVVLWRRWRHYEVRWSNRFGCLTWKVLKVGTWSRAKVARNDKL